MLAKWASEGCVVHHLVCTDGSKGTWDPDVDVEALAARTSDRAARGGAHVSPGTTPARCAFLDRVDGELDSDLATRSEVARVIRELQPQVILGHDPWKRYRLHPDHRHAGLLACEGIVAARDPHFYRDHRLPHHRPDALLLWEADVPDHAEDVSDFVDVKLHALAAHESQFESTMKAVDDDQLAAFGQRIRNRLGDIGRPFDMQSAEVFKLITDL